MPALLGGRGAPVPRELLRQACLRPRQKALTSGRHVAAALVAKLLDGGCEGAEGKGRKGKGRKGKKGQALKQQLVWCNL